MATITEQIRERAFELLKAKPEGLRYGQLATLIQQSNLNFNRNTIGGSIWDLDAQFPDKVYKPSRGLFRLVEFKDAKTDQLKQELVTKAPKKLKEEDFYKSFADWLVNDMEECTKAIPLGGICSRTNGERRMWLANVNPGGATLSKRQLKLSLRKSNWTCRSR